MTTATPGDPTAGPGEDLVLSRGRTARRILVTIVLYVALRVAGALLAALVVFELLYALMAQTPPPDRVRRFANRTVAYVYETLRYVSYNRVGSPFPFEELPDEVDPIPSAEALASEEPLAEEDAGEEVPDA